MLELNNTYQGDCLELMKEIDDKSIDMILADLPYNSTALQWDCLIDLTELWNEYERISKDGTAFVFTSSQPFTTELIKSKPEWFRYEWIWIKNNSTGFQLANKRPMKKHENIIVFYREQPVYNPQGLKPCIKENKRGKVGDYMHKTKKNQYTQTWKNYPTSVLNFAYDNEKHHPTQKPVALFEYLIKTYTNEGDTVLDNVIGSGTTGVACKKLNRNFIGIELDENYCETARERVEQTEVEMESDENRGKDITEL